eukprot:13170509-Alexandrium_andersonii.AAC.1
MHPSRASGTNSEDAPGPAQFKVRTPEAILHFMHGRLRIEADWSIGEHWADWGLHFGQPAM